MAYQQTLSNVARIGLVLLVLLGTVAAQQNDDRSGKDERAELRAKACGTESVDFKASTDKKQRLQSHRCNGPNVSLENTNSSAVRTTVNDGRGIVKQKEDYVLVSNNCFEQDICLALVSIQTKFQNEKGLLDLSKALRKGNVDKKILSIFFFDKINTAKSFDQGKIHPSEIGLYAIGEYRYDEKEEYLKMRIIEDSKSKVSEKKPEWKVVFRKTKN
jgi:hypothetical protein